MELQVPHSVCAKVQKKCVFRRKTLRDTRNTETIMPMERRGNN